ncbi:MAG TPA: ElyC/SanA/YdcF family protein [Pyrinomonadaceae bacterium]|jgi:vancomycin permeability regulator SanA
MKWLQRITLGLITLGLVGLFVAYIVSLHVKSYKNQRLQTSITEIPSEEPPRVAIVFGARVWSDGSPSNALYDRVVTAVELYRAGRVRKLLMSGDNPTHQYDEPTAMKQTAMQLGVPETDIVLDFAGRRTYDTCYRAKEIFEVQKAILVTQEFHQARALYLCSNLGVDSIGITANRRQYEGENYWAFREFFSIFSAWLEMNFLPFEPIKGAKEPIQP